MIFLDTNAVIWLYEGKLEIFPNDIKELLESEELYVSPFVKLELQYLLEVGRINVKPEKLLSDLNLEIGLTVHNLPLATLIEEAVGEPWTRDPFDRLIVAHAKAQKSPLVTKDADILRHYKLARWNRRK